MNTTYLDLLGLLDTTPVFNTHSHHYPQDQLTDMDLMKLLHLTYLQEDIVACGSDTEILRDFQGRMQYNSYFVWLAQGLQALYEIDSPLNPENMVQTETAVKDAYSTPGHSVDVLEKKCRYRYMIVDSYWNPGEIDSSSEIFLPTYRINMYLYGYDQLATDHNGNNPYQVNHWQEAATLDEYLSFMHDEFEKQLAKGCVALKCASAYDRGLDFKKTKKEDAQRAFLSGKIPGAITKKEIEDFQNFIFYDICKFAANHQIPLQCHTGLGILHKTSAIYLQEAISDHPETRFVLFHGNYPWMDDLYALVYTYRNVYVDLCWLPLISTCEAKKFLNTILDIGDLSKICWGCDTWLAEDSFGALQAMKHVLCCVLGDKIDQGLLDLQSAEKICHKILYENAYRLYIKK